MASSNKDDRGKWAEVTRPSREFERTVTKTRTREPEDLPDVRPGAKEIALLTIFKEEQRFAFQPVMAALNILEQMKDWSGSYLVADRVSAEFFSWKNAPLRKYKSFEDFYRRELRSVWGAWEELQRRWAAIGCGDADQQTEEQKIEERARVAQAADAADRANPSQQGKRTDLIEQRARQAQVADAADRGQPDFFDNKKQNIQEVSAPTGTSVAAALRRLRKDRPDIHARVLAGEITANAGMIEAGFRKPAPSRKLSIIDRMMKLWNKATPEERAEILRRIGVIL